MEHRDIEQGKGKPGGPDAYVDTFRNAADDPPLEGAARAGWRRDVRGIAVPARRPHGLSRSALPARAGREGRRRSRVRPAAGARSRGATRHAEATALRRARSTRGLAGPGRG